MISTFAFLLFEVALTGASWGLLGYWLAGPGCSSSAEYDLFFGLWLASIVTGMISPALAISNRNKLAATLLLLVLFANIMLWVEYGGLVVAANCPRSP